MFRFIALFILLISSSSAIEFYTVNLPPFSFVNESIEGPFKEVAIQTCKKAGLRCKFKTSPWKRIMMEVKAGRFNACFVVGKNSSRESWMYFSTPVVETEYGFFFNSKNGSGPRSHEELSSYNIVVHQKSNTAKKLKALKDKNNYSFKIIEEIDVSTSIKKFAGKRYPKNTLLYGNRDINSYLFKQINAKDIKYALKDRPIKYRFGFSKKSVKRIDFERFNESLKKLKSDGIVDKIFQKQ